MNLFDVGGVEAPETLKAMREPELCPVCGRMALYVERFESGRIMASHGGKTGTFEGRVSGCPVEVQCSDICHGYQIAGTR